MSNIFFDISINPTIINQKYFVFSGNQYPIDFELFKKNSVYFFKNQNQYKDIKFIQLFEVSEAEKFDDIPDSAITNFISLCQNEKCKITNSDIFYIQYLSYKYQVTSLLQVMTDIIISNSKQLEFESFLFKYLHKCPNNDMRTIFSEEESIIISSKLEDDRLFKFPISTLYQILLKYFERKSSHKKGEINVIVDFLYKCLEKYGTDASILFSLIELNQQIIVRLTQQYSQVFDINLVNSNLFEFVKEKMANFVPSEKFNNDDIEEEEEFDDSNKSDNEITDFSIQLENNKNNEIFDVSKDFHFSQNSRIKNIVIPSTMKSIGIHMFFKCSSLTQVVIPLTVKYIDNYAFSECSSLKNILIPSSIKLIGNYSFFKCTSITSLSIPSSVESIGCKAFAGCNRIREITIDPYKTLFEENTFDGCSLLRHFIFGSSTRIIKQFNFNLFGKITNVTIPSYVLSIENFSFNKFNSLKRISIASSVFSIPKDAFNDCPNIKEITMNPYKTQFESNNFKCFQSLNHLIFDSSISSISKSESNIFNSFSIITIPKSVKSIEKDAFKDCSSLTKITI